MAKTKSLWIPKGKVWFKHNSDKRPWSDVELKTFEKGLSPGETETRQMVREEWKRRGYDEGEE